MNYGSILSDYVKKNINKMCKIDHEVKFECLGQHKVFIKGNKG